jgi:hypothetical protein
MAGVMITVASSVLLTGALNMLRLRGYALAATASIVAMIPWSPGWLVGLPCGIWACVVLGQPAVAAAFLSEKRPAASGSAGARKPKGRVAGMALSLLRSVGRYFLTTRLGQRPVTDSSPDASSFAGQSPAPASSEDDPREGR